MMQYFYNTLFLLRAASRSAARGAAALFIPAAAGFSTFRAGVCRGSRDGKQFFQISAAAGFALQRIRITLMRHDELILCSALIALVFINRHGYMLLS
jgi:hypothetical protein